MDTDVSASESTALLPKSQKKTPLPWFQISIILIVQICEPIAAQSIYPYINRLVSELDVTGGDTRKVGYYAGLIESLFFATEAMTVLHWSRASDRFGRKPILLIGMIGTTISMLSFGLSRTFWALVISRCITGLLNGNVGVMKCVMGELTDQSNRADATALMPIVWAIGSALGSLIGGSFSNPQEQYPKWFGGSFWREYPYFLPCFVPSCIAFTASILMLCFLKETNPMHATSVSSDDALLNTQKPPSMQKVLTYPVVLSISNYVVLAFLTIAVYVLLPLFFAMPIEFGGLGFQPPTIGLIMGGYGAFTGLFQVFFFAKIIRRFGERTIFIASISLFLPMFAMLPVMSIYARSHGVTSFIGVFIAIILMLMSMRDMAFGSIFMYITASAPSRQSLGATNGLAQMAVSTAKAIGPALSTSLFSFSVEHNILGGYGVYAFLFVLSCLGVVLASYLPQQMWDESDSDHLSQ